MYFKDLRKPEFSSTTKNSFFLLKTHTKTILQLVTDGNAPTLALKRMLEHFLKIPPHKKILEFQDWKKDYETSPNKKITNQKLSQWLKTYKMSFTN